MSRRRKLRRAEKARSHPEPPRPREWPSRPSEPSRPTEPPAATSEPRVVVRKADLVVRLAYTRSRAGARHQPLHPSPPPAIRGNDRDALGRQANPSRRARAHRRRAAPCGACSSADRATGTEAIRSAQGPRAYQRRSCGWPELPSDRRRPQRERNADRARRSAMVAVDGSHRSRACGSRLGRSLCGRVAHLH